MERVRVLIGILMIMFLIVVAKGETKVEFLGHSGSVDSVVYSPDGRFIVSGSSDSTIKIWEAKTGRLVRTLKGHKYEVDSVSYSPDGKFIASGGCDKYIGDDCKAGIINIWEVDTGRLVRTIKGHKGWINSVSYSPDGRFIVSGGCDKYRGDSCKVGTINIWEANTGKFVRTLEGHKGWVRSVSYSPDGKFIVSGSWDKTIKIWEANTGRLIRTIDENDGVNSVSYSPDGKFIVSGCGSFDNTIKIWEANTGRLIRTLERHNDMVNSVAYSPDGRFIVSGSFEKINIWEANTGRLVRTIKENDSVNSVSYSPDGKFIVSGGWNGTIKIWEVNTGRLVRTIEGHNSVSSVSYSPDGKFIASGRGGEINIWEAKTSKLARTIDEHDSYVSSVSYSPDGKFIVSGSNEKIKIWNTNTGRLVRTIKGHKDWVNSVSYSPDGKFIVSGSEDSTINIEDSSIKIWEANTGKLVRTIDEHYGDVNSVSYSPDGKFIVSAGCNETIKGVCEGGAIKIWEANTGRLVRTIDEHYDYGWVNSVSYSPDGKFIVSGSDEKIKIWNANTGKLVRTIKGHNDMVNSVSYSPDGKFIVSGSSDETIKIWEANTGRLVRTLKGHNNIVNSVNYSPDGKFIVSGGGDGKINIWNANSGKLLITLTTYPDGKWIAITPKGYYIGSDGVEDRITIYKNGKTYADSELIKKVFYKPEIIKTYLSEKNINNTDNFKNKHIQNNNITITFITPKAFDKKKLIKVNNNNFNISFKILSSVPSENIKIKLNGHPVKNLIVNQKKKFTKVSTNVKLKNGENTLEIFIGNKNVGKYKIIYNKPKSSKNLYVLAVGINDYESEHIGNLNYAVADAKLVVNTMKSQKGVLYQNVETYLLTSENGNATKSKIKETIAQISQKAKKGDTIILYFSGYGHVDSNKEYSFPTMDARYLNNVLIGGVIRGNDFKKFFEVINGDVYLIVDTCYSEKLIRGDKNKAEILSKSIEKVRKGEIIDKNVVITSSSEDKESKEDRNYGHGVFTYYLVKKGLIEGEADKNKDRFIKLAEIKEYIKGLNLNSRNQISNIIYPKGAENEILFKRIDNLKIEVSSGGISQILSDKGLILSNKKWLIGLALSSVFIILLVIGIKKGIKAKKNN